VLAVPVFVDDWISCYLGSLTDGASLLSLPPVLLRMSLHL
jgi:hypothetical protein